MVTVLSDNKATDLDGAAGSSLWVSQDEMTESTGWTLKPEGLCKDAVCVPIPAARYGELVEGGKVNLSTAWQLMGKPVAVSKAGDVWSLGEAANDRNNAMLSLDAPNF